VPWYLTALALVPLIIPAVAIPLQLLVGGVVGGIVWGALGGALAGACLVVVRRKTWTRAARGLTALGLTAFGLLVLLLALAMQIILRPEPGARPYPTITVEVSYPGANAQVVADTVAAPIEQQIIGVEKMKYLRSQCRNDGSCTLTVAFAPGTDAALAQVLVQNRVSLAQPVLPDVVKIQGVVVKKKSPGVLAVVLLSSPDGSRDTLYLSNYAAAHLKDELSRLPGVGDITFLGQRADALRVQLDLEKLAARDLTAGDVIRALDEHKGKVGGPLADPEKFLDLVVKVTPGGVPVRLKDVTRVEVGAEPSSHALLDGKAVVGLVIHPLPEANVGEVSVALQGAQGRARAALPAGVAIDTRFDFTANLEASDGPTTPEYLLLEPVLPADASPRRTLAVLEHCTALLRAVEGVQDVLALTEDPFDRSRDRPCILVRLAPAGGKRAEREELARLIRTRLAAVEGVTLRLRDLSGPGRFPGCGYPVALAVHGPAEGQVKQLATKLAARLRRSQKLTDVRAASEAEPLPQLYMDIDAAEARRLGVSVEEINKTMQAFLGKWEGPDFNRFGRTWKVTVEADPRFRLDLAEAVRNLRVRSAGGQTVPLSRVVAVRMVAGAAVVDRLNSEPMMEITANPAPGVSLGQARALCEALAEQVRNELGLPAAYRLTWLQDMPAPE
jgi:multidrug efflux pump subunit AcrB